MRKISQVKVDEVAFHILDHHSNQGLVLSHSLISTVQRDFLAKYICHHIVQSLGDESAKAAKFLDSQSADSIARIAQATLASTNELLNNSQRIAEALYEIIKGDKRISSGVLAVCFFEDLADGNQRYLAIIKFDRGSSFRESVNKNAAGKSIIDVETIDNTMPSAKEKLQKCAFIRLSAPANNYDLLVLDRQSKENDGVSQFFAQKFLNLEFAFDAKTRTEELYKGLIVAANKLRSKLNVEQNSNLRQATNYVVRTEKVDVDDFIEGLAIPFDAKIIVEQEVMQRVPDRKFKIDPQVGLKLTEKKKLKGEQGVEIKIDAKYYDQVVQEISQPDKQGYSTILLKVRNLKES